MPLQLHHKIIKKKKKNPGSKHLLPFNAKYLLGCEPKTEHQKIDKNVLDQDIDSKDDKLF